MKQWLEKTHRPLFELLRHFLSSSFENDRITPPGQTLPALIGAFSLFLPWFPIICARPHTPSSARQPRTSCTRWLSRSSCSGSNFHSAS